jgi:hypothetical protein
MGGKGSDEPLIPSWLRPDAEPKLREDIAASRTHAERLRGADITGNPFDPVPLNYKMPQILKKPSQQ